MKNLILASLILATATMISAQNTVTWVGGTPGSETSWTEAKNWSKEKAKREWQKLAPEVIHLADREINRMLKWPAQVISYEYGKMKLIKAKEKYLKKNKSILSFHEAFCCPLGTFCGPKGIQIQMENFHFTRQF